MYIKHLALTTFIGLCVLKSGKITANIVLNILNQSNCYSTYFTTNCTRTVVVRLLSWWQITRDI